MKQKSEATLAESIGYILRLLLKGKFRELFLAPTDNALLQFFRYCFVGGIATVVDWGVLYVTEWLGLHYLLAGTAGFFFGLGCNFALSKWAVFNGNQAKLAPGKEFLAYCAIGAAGLGITLGLMYVLTDILLLYFMLSKVIATVLVLIWNFLARKLLLYR